MDARVMTEGRGGLRGLSRRTWLLVVAGVLLTALLAVVAGTSLAWGSSLRDSGRLLPGTTIASVDVSDATVDEAVAAVEEHLAPRLDRVVALVHGERRWTTSARELGATTDVEAVVAEAFDRTVAAGFTDLVRMRWVGGRAGLELDVRTELPEGAGADLVGSIAEELDRDPKDARVTWQDGALELAEDRAGREVDVEAAARALDVALNGGDAEVELPVARLTPEVTTAAARSAIASVGPVVDAALDRRVTASLDGRSWTVTPRELDAVPDVAPLIAGVLAGGDEPGTGEVGLDIPEAALSSFVGRIAAEVDQPARDAQLDWSKKQKRITPERNGVAVDRGSALTDLRRGLEGGASEVELRQVTVRPSVTSASFDRLLLVNQAERRLYLYDGDDVVRSWPVAVGLAGSPTPTGVFTVGAKRYEPTWYNPAPTRWGADMPAQIGPGPDNPLGARALNWNQNGRDTLIRFHGTPNESSIGEAASRGCVRMLNADVIELYDLVATGTTIVSITG